MGRRYCQMCGKPLGSTEDLCHECGGRSFRGVRNSTPTTPLTRKARAGMAFLFGGGQRG